MSLISNKTTYVLGVYYGHNATACLLKNGEVLAAASEERFNNIKNYSGFPKNAIDYVLKEAGISSKDLNLVTIAHRYGTPIHSMGTVKKGFFVRLFILLYMPVGIIRKIWGNIAFKFDSLRFVGRLFYLLSMHTVGFLTNKREMNFLADYLGIDRNKVKAYDHHLSHAASAYYSSPFNEKKVLVMTLDGEGDSFCSSINIFEKGKFKTLSRTPRENSPGLLYAYLTEYLGMKSNEHEYKVMGLAPYAPMKDVEKVYRKIEKALTLNKEALVFVSLFNTVDTKKFLEKNMKGVRFDVVAGVFQRLLEERIIELVREAIKKTNVNTLVLAGGVFMNVRINQRIANLKEVKDLFIIPSCGDESSIIGSSYLGFIDLYKKNNSGYPNISPIKDIYWGPEIKDKDIEKTFKNNDLYKKYKVEKIENMEQEVAKLLSEGNVVARVSGRMEFGARALGNRSILADPRNVEIVKLINDLIKGRDFWMPFAPSILDYRLKDYLKNYGKYEANYMMMTYETTDKGRIDLKAAMHQADYTVRPQVVKEDFNPEYYKLLKEFEKLTGVGGILNTSFNLHGYPIILGAKEALFVLKNSGLKYLALNNHLISKE